MSNRKNPKSQRVLSRSMTMSDLEEWFEAEFRKIRRRAQRKRHPATVAAVGRKKEKHHA
ncbi:hypothetical protein [Agrobacterium tumefaciens]|uniref:hypothetical protein n=1 Tax=Agrobacterium tumefaciens TaxID=358 RepID=UPI001571AB59|nr:hypothetical protein [Agrobacterium tumefaciens]NTE35230.1 hypothetical protein [Agrobacterium tumefaciens]NTE50740.1 hypothetical protein [Agrobacterium tumefaciens]